MNTNYSNYLYSNNNKKIPVKIIDKELFNNKSNEEEIKSKTYDDNYYKKKEKNININIYNNNSFKKESSINKDESSSNKKNNNNETLKKPDNNHIKYKLYFDYSTSANLYNEDMINEDSDKINNVKNIVKE